MKISFCLYDILARYYLKGFFPAFNDIETEAENNYQQLLDKHDSENVWDESITWLGCTLDVRQSLVNLYAVGLRHLFEQQLCYLVSCLLQERQRKAEYNNDKDVLIDSGEINIKSFRSWERLEELRYVSNAVKHAEGSGVKSLERVRPDLFNNPLYSELPYINIFRKKIASTAAPSWRRYLSARNGY